MSSMKAVRIHSFGGPEVVRLEDLSVPQPKGPEMLLRVRAASVNPVDYKTRAGAFPVIREDDLPLTLGRDVSGTVEAAGPQAAFRPGEELFALLGNDRGSLAEYVLVTGGEAALKPAGLSHVEAAAIPLAALTAWQGLFDHGGLRPGQKVLIHGGAGGVGHFAVQLASEKGAEVVTTASSADLDFVRRMGAAEAIDYRAQRFEDLVKDVDVVLDLVAGETQDRSWQVLKPGGVLVSTLGAPPKEKARARQARGIGFLVAPSATQLAEIGALVDAGRIRPMLHSTFPFVEALEAERRHEEGHVRGKIVVSFAA